MIVQPLDALKERLRESRLFSEEKLAAVCSGPKWEAAQDIPQGLRAVVASKALTAWQAQMLYAGKTTLRFGNYILLDRLSQDPQNRTFLAEHDSMGRKVALKQLSREHTQNEKVSKTFLNKVRAFAGVNHPRIVHLFDVAQDHDRFYVVKELVEGENLAAAVAAQGTSNRARACRWIVEIAEGVQALHDNGIAHLDLHPGTILVQKDGSIKILEPGTYETAREAAHVAYLAPEAQGEQGSPSADLYSLGMLAHLVLTGQQRGSAPAPLFEAEIATLTGNDPAARAEAAARLREAALPLAEAAPAASGAYSASDIVEAEEIIEAEPYDAVDPLDAPFAPLDAPFDPLGAPFDPLGTAPLLRPSSRRKSRR
jgi:serine/threonine protein kinase